MPPFGAVKDGTKFDKLSWEAKDSGSPLHREKGNAQNHYQGIWKFCQNTEYAQVVNSTIQKIKDIVLFLL